MVLHAVIVEQTLRIAFDGLEFPDSVGALSDRSLPVRWFLILRHGLPGTWDPNWSHVLFVPFVSLYFVGQKKKQLLVTPKHVFGPGLLIVALGMLGYSAGLFPIRNDMARGYSMVLTLFGAALFALGPRAMKHLWFPILYLAFSIKVSDRVWSIVASNLQGIVSQSGYWTLEILSSLIDFRVNLRGHTLEVTAIGDTVPQSLNVAEACSGMRSLMTFIVLGTAMAFLGTRPVWQRLTLLASIPFVAIAMNTARITVLGLLTAFGRHDMAHGDFHTLIGLVMLVPAAGTFALLGWILNRVFIEEDESKPETPVRQAPTSGPTTPPPDARAWWSVLRPQPLLKAIGIGIAFSLLVFGCYLGTMLFLKPAAEIVPFQLPAGVYLAGVIAASLALLGVIGLAKRNAGSGGAGTYFAIATLISALLTATAIQGGVLRATQVVMIKNAVPLRKSLESLPTELGTWTLIEREPRLSPEIQEELGTDQYITFVYEDLNWPRREPGGRMRLHLPYYTGNVDTVPHVPDRCFVAGGVVDSEIKRVQLSLPMTGAASWRSPSTTHATTINATLFRYRQPLMPTVDDEPATVVYFFVANGRFLPNPELVRAQGFDPRDKYAYFAKIEIQPLPVPSATGRWRVLPEAEAQQRIQAFLNAAADEILKCLPDWGQVQAGQWPPRHTPPATTSNPPPKSLH